MLFTDFSVSYDEEPGSTPRSKVKNSVNNVFSADDLITFSLKIKSISSDK